MHQVLQGSHEQDKVMDLCIHLKHVHSCRSRARPLSTLHPPVPKMHDAHLLVCCVPCGREGELQSSQSVSSVMPSAPARAARLPARTHARCAVAASPTRATALARCGEAHDAQAANPLSCRYCRSLCGEAAFTLAAFLRFCNGG